MRKISVSKTLAALAIALAFVASPALARGAADPPPDATQSLAATTIPVGDGGIALRTGIVKICKVAGSGITIGTPFTFHVGNQVVTVPAGPAPGGTCEIGPSFLVGLPVTVTEQIPAGDAVSSITVAPASQLANGPSLAGGSVTVTVGPGVTEVTYTNERTGYLEICKRGDVKGSFTFHVNPGNLGPYVVPAGACSPAIKVAAGSVVIQEAWSPFATLSGCTTLPANRQGACAGLTSTVIVPPGDVSNQTIAIITNRPRIWVEGPDTSSPASPQ